MGGLGLSMTFLSLVFDVKPAGSCLVWHAGSDPLSEALIAMIITEWGVDPSVRYIPSIGRNPSQRLINHEHGNATDVT